MPSLRVTVDCSDDELLERVDGLSLSFSPSQAARGSRGNVAREITQADARLHSNRVPPPPYTAVQDAPTPNSSTTAPDRRALSSTSTNTHHPIAPIPIDPTPQTPARAAASTASTVPAASTASAASGRSDRNARNGGSADFGPETVVREEPAPRTADPAPVVATGQLAVPRGSPRFPRVISSGGAAPVPNKQAASGSYNTFYAVTVGLVPGIYSYWPDALQARGEKVHGKRVVSKRFLSLREAEEHFRDSYRARKVIAYPNPNLPSDAGPPRIVTDRFCIYPDPPEGVDPTPLPQLRRDEMAGYVVEVGWKTGLFYTWEEARAQIRNFQGAKYHGYPTREEAEAKYRELFR
ncbi:hypothetical protein BV25DRAFT_1921413 [Artomyces pyxidatus]|uniref:Uncharacterized protein n=1 Tax=Artomyces pyxidatus TaxID=48021 RepID=A0ACB8SHT3_9AGAM|nr:hypothetical protein BV25DRAFT_1921413 [Artomyces pyxidatus]